ncbi:hypothetical protein O181_110883 [Austropuccinia psidii MF-1]|uniref:Uncharacterized protein n=1 Tax=Austropuccinia psidii MF-1 TaxID=1389203 RepID=A0A9Q3JYL4_9BASI|nr:hypothetical protein [Austropuccinia psidii MF-1]
MDFCTCPSCRTHTSTDESGISRQGLFVSRNTRCRHWAKLASKTDEIAISNDFQKKILPRKRSTRIEKSESNDELNNVLYENINNQSQVRSFVLYFIMWLYLTCGLSRLNCRKARDMIIHLINLLLPQNEETLTLVAGVPRDIQTIIKHLQLEFHLENNPCGTELYQIFKLQPLPQIKFTSPKPTVAATPYRSGQIRLSRQPRLRIPNASFITQPLSDWLAWFINLPGVGNNIESWADQLSSQGSKIVVDVAQGTVWEHHFKNKISMSLELGFSLLIDWFNPKGNKMAGKQIPNSIHIFGCHYPRTKATRYDNHQQHLATAHQ